MANLDDVYDVDSRTLADYRTVVEEFVAFLPFREIDRQAIFEAMALDKKRKGADLNYVLLARPGKPFIAAGIDRRAMSRAVARMLEFYESHGGRRVHNSGD